MICDACETSNKDDAQYCKGCGRLITAAGTTVASTPAAPAPPPVEPVQPIEPVQPAAPIRHTQPLPTIPSSDGFAETTAIPAQRASVDATPTAVEPAPDQPPPAWIFILSGIAIGGLLLLLVAILMGNGDESAGTPTPTSTAGATTIETVVQTTLPPASTTVPTTTTPPPPSIDEFFGSAVAIFASIPKDDATLEEAQQRANSIADATGATVRVIDSSSFASLRDGFWVVAEGNFAGPEQAAWRCWELGLQTQNECYGRQISNDPSDLNGTVFPIPQPGE